MTDRNPMAGGVFITLGIIAGLAWGISTGQATRGVLFGTAFGLFVAAIFWLVERQRRR